MFPAGRHRDHRDLHGEAKPRGLPRLLPRHREPHRHAHHQRAHQLWLLPEGGHADRRPEDHVRQLQAVQRGGLRHLRGRQRPREGAQRQGQGDGTAARVRGQVSYILLLYKGFDWY